MAKRSNNSLGRRSYGGKPYDANNSFVKKMATKVTDFIPQRSWISKWFNASQDNGDTSACNSENLEEAETEEEVQQPPSKRPRIRMDVTHPPGTFFIRPRGRDSSDENDSRKDPFLRGNQTEQDFLEPQMAGPSGIGRFVSSTPAVQTDVRNLNVQQSAELNYLIPSENNGASNGADDNSESSESTSGCSSLIPQTNRQEGVVNTTYHANWARRKRLMDDKLAFTNNHLQSPRCLFLDSNSRESLSNRRPSFNASMMSNTLDRTSSLSSPFYSGNVTFGGANALGHYKRSRSLFNSTNEFQLKVPRRTSVQVKPSSSECIDASGMSQTAKRILEAMEYFSSPISDAKKIPVKKSDPASSIGGRKRSREDEQAAGPTARVGLRHLTRELAVPTVPEMLKLRRRQKLQDTTVAARKIVSAMSGPPPVSSATVTARPAAEEYHLRTELDQDPKFHGKLRTKSKKNPKEEGPAPSLNLPRISLAITSLPSFEPLPKYTKPANRETPIAKETETNSGYKFASPIKMSEAAWNLKSINNFSFSKPIIAEGKDDSREFNMTSNTISKADSFVGSSISNSIEGAATTNFMWTGSSTAPRLKVKTKPDKETTKISASPKESSELRFGSVMDILGGKSFTSEGSQQGFSSQKSSPRSSNSVNPTKSLGKIWECTECYIKNDSSEKLCVACKAPKPSLTSKKLSPQASSVPSKVGTAAAQQPHKIASTTDCFGSQFKMNTNQWECSSCLVRNKHVDVVCVSCTSPKPSQKVPTNLGSASSLSSAKSDLMDKFKPAEGSWECPGCMLRNPSTVITCPCCNASKPSFLNAVPKKPSLEATANDKTNKSSELMEKFKPATSSWECSSCLVRNSEIASVCVCCSNPKPRSSSAIASKTTISPKTTTISGWGDKFKKPEGTWSCDSCMLQNKAEVTECVACGGLKAGATPKATPVPASNFSFGIPASAQNLNSNKAKTETGSWNGFSFGVKSSNAEANVTGSQFTFGIPPSEAEKTKSSSTIGEKPTGFVFASPKNAEVSGGFKFEVNAKTNASETSDAAKSSSGSQEKKETFSFGLPKSVSGQITSDEKETIFGASSAIGNGKPRLPFGVNANETDVNAFKTNIGFDAANSEKSTSEISKPTSSNETNRIGVNSTKSSNIANDKQSATITTSLTSTNPSLTATASIAFSSETRPSFTFSEPNSKLRSQPTITPNFGDTSMNSLAPVASSTFSIAAQKTSETTLNPDIKQSTISNFAIGGSMATPFGTAAPSSAPSPSPSLDKMPIGSVSTACPPFKPAFFGMPEEKKPSAFGAVEKKNHMFGTVENKPTPVFDCNNDKSTSNPIFNSPSPAFGQPAAASQQPLFGSSTTPVFGNSSSVPSFGTTAAVDTPNIFASGKTNVTSAPTSTGLFTFGAAAPQPSATPAPGAFSFSAGGTSANSAAKPIFPFGGTTTPQTSETFASGGSSIGGTFGTSASINPTPSPFTFNAPAKQDPPTFGQTSTAIPSMFGAQPATPSLGQSQSASNFLPNAPASSTGFNFGASAPPATSGGFNFGGSMTQSANAPSTDFNFNAVSPSPAIAFNPNTPPSFNFTGGSAPTGFNATPQPATTRKIKKAVRRMPQRP